MFHLSIPLDSPTPKKQAPVLGISLQGKRQYEVLALDTRLLNFSALGAIEPKYVIGGLVAAGAAIAIWNKDKSVQQRYQEQRQERERYEEQRRQEQQQNCPVKPKCGM
jgi:hypothetical protein